MKRDILLLVDADADTASVVCSAAALSGLDVRLVLRSSDFFAVMEHGLTDVAVIVLDVDPGVHGTELLETLDAYDLMAPVIIISSLEQAHLHPAAIAHEARMYLGKPASIERLRTAIAMLARAPEAQGCRGDVWGHPRENCIERRAVPNEGMAMGMATFLAAEY
jgi:DNA-binding NtrC family response regulator